MGELESAATHRGYGTLHKRVSTATEIHQKYEYWPRVGDQHEELQEVGAALHRAEKRSYA